MCAVCQADMQLVKKGHIMHAETAEKAAEVLMSCFRICAGDRYVDIHAARADEIVRPH